MPKCCSTQTDIRMAFVAEPPLLAQFIADELRQFSALACIRSQRQRRDPSAQHTQVRRRRGGVPRWRIHGHGHPAEGWWWPSAGSFFTESRDGPLYFGSLDGMREVDGGGLRYIGGETFAESGGVVGVDMGIVRRARDGDIGKPGVDQTARGFGVDVGQNAALQ